MASYVERTLTTGERVLLTRKIALRQDWFRFFIGTAIILAGVAALAVEPRYAVWFFLVGVALILPPILRWLTNELALTNKRVIAKFGIVSLRTLEIRLDKIESVGVHQSLFGRLLNYGTVVITGTGSSHEPFPDIVDPVQFKRQFDEEVDRLKQPAG